MRIEIYQKDKNPKKIIVPTSLIFSPVSFLLFSTSTKEFIKIDSTDFPTLKTKDMINVMKVIKTCKMENPDWSLVDVVNKDTFVKIKL
jgi:hypothetical protein